MSPALNELLKRAHADLAVVRGFVLHCEQAEDLDLPPDDRTRLEVLVGGLDVLVAGLK